MNSWWSNYGQCRRDTDGREWHCQVALRLATTVLIAGRLLHYRNPWASDSNLPTAVPRRAQKVSRENAARRGC